MTYDCMTADELALWQQGAEADARQTGHLVKSPCVDCPLAFRRQEKLAGRCCQPLVDAEPMPEAERVALRIYKREWMRAWRASQRAA